MLTEANETQ